MQFTPGQLKDKLLKCLDAENNVVDMAGCLEVISVLESYPITREALERTRIGKHVNELRKKTSNDQLSKRAKKLVRSWQKLISTPSDKHLVNGEKSSVSPALSQQTSRVWSKPNNAAGLVCRPESPAVSKSSLSSVGHEKPITPKSGQSHTKPNTPSLPPVHIQQRRLFSSQEAVSSPRLHLNHPGVVSGNISHKSVISPKCSSSPSTPVSITNPSGISSPSLGHSRPQTPLSFNGGGSRPQTPVSQSITGDPEFVNRLPRNSSQEFMAHLPGQKFDHSNVSSSRKNKSDQKYSSKSRKRPSEDLHMTVIAPKLTLMTGKDCQDVVNGSVCSASVKLKYAERKRTKGSNADSVQSLSGFCAKKNVNLSLKTDHDKEKMPTVVSKTLKVKTTAQLIAELQAKSGSDTVGKSVIHQIETNQIVKEVDAPLSVVPPGAKPRARKKANAEESPENLKPPSNPISWTQTKNDLVQRYLQSSVTASLPEDISPFKDDNCKLKLHNLSYDIQDSGIDIDVVSKQCASKFTEQKSHVRINKEAKLLSLAEIYNLLPPLDLDNFELDDSTYEATEPREPTDSDVDRFNNGDWEGVNGSFDNNKQWHYWTEMFSIEAYNGENINILPYVVTD